jgi:hypothetical protein
MDSTRASELWYEIGFGCGPAHSEGNPAPAWSHHASRRCAMRAYLKAVAIIASLLGTYLALLPLTV